VEEEKTKEEEEKRKKQSQGATESQSWIISYTVSLASLLHCATVS